MTPRITEFSGTPSVGQWFLVPTLRGYWNNRFGTFPVIGAPHSDAEFLDFPEEHYHIDGRFLAPRVWQQLENLFQSSERAVAARPYMLYTYKNEKFPQGNVIAWRKRQFHRHFDYPFKDARTKQFRRLWRAFEGAHVVQGEYGWECPHRRAPLYNIIPDAKGRIVCPLHGLCWDAKTGANVRPE